MGLFPFTVLFQNPLAMLLSMLGLVRACYSALKFGTQIRIIRASTILSIPVVRRCEAAAGGAACCTCGGAESCAKICAQRG